MTQPGVSANPSPVKQFARFDFSGELRLVPVAGRDAGFAKYTLPGRPIEGVMLRYQEPQPVLEKHFHAASTYKHDGFPLEIIRADDKQFYKLAEIHHLTSLQDLIEQGHPQRDDLVRVYQQLVTRIYGASAKTELALA